MRRRRGAGLPLAGIAAGVMTLAACGNLEIRDMGWSVGGGGVSARSSTLDSQGNALIFTNASAVTVAEGDTVYGLSRRHRVSARDIIEANGLRAPYMLNVGQRIVLPRGTVHAVKSGETLYGIANAYDANVYQLARANAIGPPYTIFVGQKIRIPGTAAARIQPAVQSATTTADGAAAAPEAQTAAIPAPAPKPTLAARAVPQPPPTTGSGFVWPVDGNVISEFGAKAQGLRNDGINIAAPEGATIRVVENGVVAYSGNELRGFGNLLLVKHADGYVTAYAHASELLVKRGDRVTRGQAIALVGSSGNVTSPQLHFELRKGKKPLDPWQHLPQLST